MAATLALAGNPNSGKTSLFNALTGARQHVGNYPGVTVEKKEGFYKDNGFEFHVVDLPGTYSLTAFSLEELVARNYLVTERPKVVVDIVDASNLERNLYLTVQFLELGLPVCIALNMVDVARRDGVEIDEKRLSSLLGVPVVSTVARSGQGKRELMAAAAARAHEISEPTSFSISYGDDIDRALLEMGRWIEEGSFLSGRYPSRWVALKYLESDEEVISEGRSADAELSAKLETKVRAVASHVSSTLNIQPEGLIADHRYGFINALLKRGVIVRRYDENRIRLSDKIDRVLTNRFLGPLIMAAVVFTLYQVTFSSSETPIGWVESFFGFVSGLADTYLPNGLLKSLLISGIIDGVGGVLGFVPLIMFMFLGIAILEDTGYLARIAFMLDRVFAAFGLHGSSVIPFIVGGGIAGGCAVPGIMAARTLRSPKERLATLLTVPFMNCGAKLPLMALLIGTFFSKHEGLLMFLFTVLAWLGALAVAKLLRMTVVRGAPTPFVMELPPYRLPTLKGLLIHTWERTWQYIKKAGTVILGISILLWAMMTFPGLPQNTRLAFETAERNLLAAAPAHVKDQMGLENASPEAAALKQELERLRAEEAEVALRNSFAGRIGSFLEPVSRWAGFDWKINIALVGGIAAKEVVVSTLGTAYSLGDVDPEESASLSETLAASPDWSGLLALSVILFSMFYAPCFVSVVCMVRESGSWKWGAFSIIFNTTLAFSLAVLVYQGGRFFGLLGG